MAFGVKTPSLQLDQLTRERERERTIAERTMAHVFRFTRMKTMKGLELLLLSFNEATQACKVAWLPASCPSRFSEGDLHSSLPPFAYLKPIPRF